MTDTRPGALEAEARRIAKEMLSDDAARNDDIWRMRQAEALGELRASVRYLSDTLAQHVIDDKNQFDQLNNKQAGVSSSVTRAQGAKDMFVWLLGGLAVVLAGFWAVVTFLWPRK